MENILRRSYSWTIYHWNKSFWSHWKFGIHQSCAKTIRLHRSAYEEYWIDYRRITHKVTNQSSAQICMFTWGQKCWVVHILLNLYLSQMPRPFGYGGRRSSMAMKNILPDNYTQISILIAFLLRRWLLSTFIVLATYACRVVGRWGHCTILVLSKQEREKRDYLWHPWYVNCE